MRYSSRYMPSATNCLKDLRTELYGCVYKIRSILRILPRARADEASGIIAAKVIEKQIALMAIARHRKKFLLRLIASRRSNRSTSLTLHSQRTSKLSRIYADCSCHSVDFGAVSGHRSGAIDVKRLLQGAPRAVRTTSNLRIVAPRRYFHPLVIVINSTRCDWV